MDWKLVPSPERAVQESQAQAGRRHDAAAARTAGCERQRKGGRHVPSPERAAAKVTGLGMASPGCRPCSRGQAIVWPRHRLLGRPKLATSRLSPVKEESLEATK